MNDQEKSIFAALTKNRAGLAIALESPALRGVRYNVVEKYSDQAHFIVNDKILLSFTIVRNAL